MLSQEWSSPDAAQAEEQLIRNGPPWGTSGQRQVWLGMSLWAVGRDLFPILLYFLDYIQFQAHKCKKKIDKLEWVQHCPEADWGLKPSKQKWKEVSLFSLEQTHSIKGQPTAPHYLWGQVQHSMEREQEATGINWNKEFKLDRKKRISHEGNLAETS